MIDFVKVRLDSDTMQRLRSNPALEFKGKFSEQTGDVLEYPRTASYKGMLFEIRSAAFCVLSGSLHKFARNGKNHDDFSHADVVAAIRELEALGIDPEEAKLQNLEFGVNIRDLPVSPATFVRSVLTHRGQTFSRMRGINRQPLGIDCYHQRYGLKIYDKGKQYNLPDPVLRLEIKHTKMHDLNAAGIHTLADLTNPDAWPYLSANLAARIDELLLIEPELRHTDLRPGERRKLADYENPKWWEAMKTKSPKNHDYHRQRYRALIARHVPNSIQSIILEKCKDKMRELSPKTGKTLAKLTDPEKPNPSQINSSSSVLIRLVSTKQVNPADNPTQIKQHNPKVQFHEAV